MILSGGERHPLRLERGIRSLLRPRPASLLRRSDYNHFLGLRFESRNFIIYTGGERGIRTLVTLRQTAFRELRDQPLCHLSVIFTDFDWCRERDLVAPPAATRLSSSSKWHKSLLGTRIQIPKRSLILIGAEKGIWTLTPYGHTRLRRTCLPFHHLGKFFWSRSLVRVLLSCVVSLHEYSHSGVWLLSLRESRTSTIPPPIASGSSIEKR